MILKDTILSAFTDRGTLLKWLKKVETAVRDSTLTDISIDQISETQVKFKFTFENGDFVESPVLTLPRGEKGDKGDTGATGATGATPNISVTATELPAGSPPTATRSGTDENPLITFGIPQAGGGEQLYMHSISLLPSATSSGTVFSFTIFSYSNLEYNNETISEYVKNHGDDINVPGFIGNSDNHYPITRLTTSNNNLSIYYFTETGELSFELFNSDPIVDGVTPL